MIATWLLALGLAAAAAASTDPADTLAEARRLDRAGDSARALSMYRSLLQRAPADALRADVLESLAGLESKTGDYVAASRHALDAAAIHKTSGDLRKRAGALNMAGVASLYAGQYDPAERTLRDAIAISRTTNEASALCEEIMNLGNVFFFTGRYTEAARAYDDAASTIASDRSASADRLRRLVHVNRATLFQRLGSDEDALALYRRVDAEGGTLRPREQAQILMNLGVLYRRLGDPVKALDVYARSLALFERDHHVDGELGVISNRGIVLAFDLGRLDEARRTFSDALARATAVGNRREVLHAQLYRGEAAFRAGAFDAARADFLDSLEGARGLRTPEEEWKALYGLGRVDRELGDMTAATGHFAEAVGVIEAIREALRVPALRSDFFADKREVYDALIATDDGAAPGRLFKVVEQSHARAWRERLGLSGSTELAAIMRALPPDVLLLECWNSRLGSAVVVVTHDRVAVQRLSLDERMVRDLVAGVGDRPGYDWAAAASALGSRLLPDGVPAGTRHVIVVPDGVLALVPFDLLTVGNRPLVEQAAVSSLPTAAMLLRPARAHRSFGAPWRLQLEAFGDPEFASTTFDDSAAVRTRLASSRPEVESIAQALAGRSRLHVGRDDRKAVFRDESTRAPILHLATHAVADTDAIERSRILFAADEQGGEADYLFLKEAYDLRLDDVDLAVLSACETERGRMLRGEGVESFGRAFLAAGARSTVTTLWRVPDRPTAAFMRLFYYHLQSGVSKAEALRRTKLRFLQSATGLRDPHYWAAFTLTGEAMRPIPRAMRWRTAVAVIVGIVLIAAIGLRRRFAR